MESKNVLTQEFLERYKGKNPDWGFNGLGYIVYKRTYSRLKENGEKEEWWETVERCVEGAQKIGANYTRKEAERLYDLIFNLKCSLAGRMLWQLGTNTVDRFGANGLINCFYVSITEIEDFLFIFENLMLGGGVGYSVRREDIHELPRVKAGVNISHLDRKDTDFIVPDSRSGWVELLRHVLKAFFETGESFSYSTILVRGKGQPIKGFGGTASGPKILTEGIDKICKVIDGRSGKKLRSIDVLDICNIIGSIVVAGNVRRSAEIAIGDPDDFLFVRAKNWSNGKVPNWRTMSNNTIQADDFDHISNEVWSLGYEIDPKTGSAKGEPYGFFNLPLCQSKGRLKDPNVKDDCEGVNPCAEIALSSYESCNLAELFLNRIESEAELFDCAKLLYKTQKAVCDMKFIHSKTTNIVRKNRRLGLGVTGICQALDKIPWLDRCYIKLRKFDKEWSKKMGWPESIKLTTIKPSGTLSLLAGATPGIHPGFSRYFIRRVTIACDDPLVENLKKMGYKTEFKIQLDGSPDHNSVIIEFPCYIGEDAVVSEDFDVIDQLELVKTLQTEWADNAVSITSYYEKEDLPRIKEWLKENYKDGVKTSSFLLKRNHGFVQAPYEEIDKESYDKLMEKLKFNVDLSESGGSVLIDLECDGGSCPVR